MSRSIHIGMIKALLLKNKKKHDDDKETLVQKALQKSLEILIQVDAHTIITPYFELEQQDKAIMDICTDFQVRAVQFFCFLKQYSLI